MLSEKLVEKLNWQVNRELYSAYFYLGMATYAASMGLKGLSNWFDLQAKEEVAHAEKIYNYVNNHGIRVVLKGIEEPPQDFTGARDLFDRTLKHEKRVSEMIDDLVKLSKEEKNKTTEDFLQWFVKEQVEEEEHAGEALEKINKAGEDKEALHRVDEELGKRRK